MPQGGRAGRGPGSVLGQVFQTAIDTVCAGDEIMRETERDGLSLYELNDCVVGRPSDGAFGDGKRCWVMRERITDTSHVAMRRVMSVTFPVVALPDSRFIDHGDGRATAGLRNATLMNTF